jgi:hypothetical protein
MSENFESTYENSIPKQVTGSHLKGGMYDDFELPLPNQDFWVEDGISLTGNPGNYSPDILNLSSNYSALGEDHISLNTSPTFNLKMSENTNANGFWKYNEDKILKQLEQYISSTYSQHYVDRTGGGTEQTLDKIKHNRREGFCAGNVTKYIDRYDTKGTPRADLFKVLHYTILLINHLNLVENK